MSHNASPSSTTFDVQLPPDSAGKLRARHEDHPTKSGAFSLQGGGKYSNGNIATIALSSPRSYAGDILRGSRWRGRQQFNEIPARLQ